jgi:stage II sporulation protein D
MKRKVLLVVVVILAVAILPLNRLFAQKIDETPIKVGILIDEEFTTFRAQSFSGHWRATFYPLIASGSAEQNPARKEVKTVSELVAEGEDLAISLTNKGLVGKLSTGKEIMGGYEKIVISGGELLNIEIPENRPMLLQGKLEIHINIEESRLLLINEINFHQFLVSSVSKFGISSEVEALKAYIVMARTRLKHLKENTLHKEMAYEVCDKYHCLPFSGAGQNRELVDILVSMTANKILQYRGKSVFPRYHHTCGGKVSSAKEIFNVDNEPYHVSVDDRVDNKGSENCFHSPGFHWSIELEKLDLLEFIAMSWAGGASRIFTGWEPLKIEDTGRITRVLLRGRIPKEIDGVEFFENLKMYFGPNSLKSMRFSMEVLRRSVIFRGMGQGLGVGMCLYGADGLAKKGKRYNEILEFYYPGVTIK